MQKDMKNRIAGAVFVVISIGIYGYASTFLKMGHALLIAALPAVPTILIATYFLKKAQKNEARSAADAPSNLKS
ncbi:hypothetical protein G4G27_07830 [Sphingomonas sp. So64.6b]|uniref:hypothetical protein n=1 Tax=Sphingomonas sp. So64.6b TaxID=2997354 RepID=UPI0016030F90|nr:hypothetical protein [Sphingomonas sp. So64.6b]QNA83906.1 hypothetical protein G4G27_07830 [Sphingomonas sp. So64.6b]